MNMKKLSLAVSAALVSGTAFAHAPTVTPDIEIFMSGASAQDKGIAALFNDLCVAGTLDTYLDGGTGKAHSAYFCTIDNAKVPGLALTNPKVLLHKRSAGGSGQGVNPVIEETPIDAMSINNGNCVVMSANKYNCSITNPGDLVQAVSDAGVSDVNPEMFVGLNTPAGDSPVNVADVTTKLDVVAAAGVVFGVPVNTAFRNALQEAQFGKGDACVGDESEACMPSLSKEQVATIMSGQLQKWNSIKVNGVALTDASVVTTVPTDLKVNICRRVNGSGTQAQMNAKFLNYPCTPNAIVPASASNPFTGPVITLNSGSGDVETCLDAADAAGKWSIGVQSTEKNANNSHAYRFIKVDGVAPTLQNAASGKYFDWAEQTFQWRKAAYNGPTGDKKTIITTIASNAGKPSIIASVLNPGFVYTWGQGGYLAVSTNGHAPAANGIFDVANPVVPYTHAPNGKLDNCRTPVVNPAYRSNAL